MVQGGEHPRGATSNQVPAINSDFTTSMKAAVTIFYNANTNCLTPSSGFREARLCTEQFAGAYLSSVTEAWDAVGVSAEPLVVVELTDGVPLTGQSASLGKSLHYSLAGAQVGETVTCTLSGSNGNADLYVKIGDVAVPDAYSSANSCKSATSGSNDSCTSAIIDVADAKVYAAVRASSAFTDVSIVCKINPFDPVALHNGAPLPDQAATAGQYQYFKLENVKAGETVGVKISSDVDSDADLYVRFGSLPDPRDSSAYDCASLSYTSYESCVLTAESDNTLYIVIHAYRAYSELTVNGRHWPSSVLLASGVESAGYSSNAPGLLQDFKLSNILAGEKVTCELIGSDGDADLFVRFAGYPETSSTSTLNACSSTNSGTSVEACTTPVSGTAQDVYASTYAVTPFSSLTVVCTRIAPPPTNAPTEQPTMPPLPTPPPTKLPTKTPTRSPTKTPTKAPTQKPTRVPTKIPTKRPTKMPTKRPTKMPSKAPTKKPTRAPTKNPTVKPIAPTRAPTKKPVSPTKAPARTPTKAPSTASCRQLRISCTSSSQCCSKFCWRGKCKALIRKQPT
jgi:Thermolysin metallopeptidase, alpha-helical domain